MGAKKFSAFKLFYDEFIYKENDSFYVVNRNLSNIYNLVLKIRSCSLSNSKYYMKRLEHINKRIKVQLNEIYEINPSLFEYYYLLYKTRVGASIDKIDDMPFIISTSFYDDYRYDNIIECEECNYIIPRYSSLEKKEIRNIAKGKSKIDFLIYVLNSSQYKFKYNQFFRMMNDLSLELKPKFNEKHFDYTKRVASKLKSVEHVYGRLEGKISSSPDSDYIYQMYRIVYHGKNTFDKETLERMLVDHFDHYFSDFKESNEIARNFNDANTMSYESYKEIVNKYISEKDTYTKLYNDGELESIRYYDNNTISKFKEVLVNAYFDKRYLDNITPKSKLEDYAERAINLYNLAVDLENQIFEKCLFDASHSVSLGRSRTSSIALLIKLYDLYNPFDLIVRYENARKDFEVKLVKLSKDDLKKYNSLLLEKKIKYDYHGPIPTGEFIVTNLNNQKINFVYEQCITDLKNMDVSGSYDTRNYDLNVICDGLSIDELISLYNKMKYKINAFDFSSIRFLDKEVNEEEYEKKSYLRDTQEFIVKNILNNLNYGNLTSEELENRYIDICYAYLNEQCLFIKKGSRQVHKTRKEVYVDQKEKFNMVSRWAQFCKDNKLKARR